MKYGATGYEVKMQLIFSWWKTLVRNLQQTIEPSVVPCGMAVARGVLPSGGVGEAVTRGRGGSPEAGVGPTGAVAEGLVHPEERLDVNSNIEI